MAVPHVRKPITTIATRTTRTGMAAILNDADARARVEPKAPDAAQMCGDDIPHRRTTRLAEARPPRRLVALRGIERPPADAHVGDAAAHQLAGFDRVGD